MGPKGFHSFLLDGIYVRRTVLPPPPAPSLIRHACSVNTRLYILPAGIVEMQQLSTTPSPPLPSPFDCCAPFAGACSSAGGILHGSPVDEAGVDGCGDVRRTRGGQRAQEDDAGAQGLRRGLAHAQVRYVRRSALGKSRFLFLFCSFGCLFFILCLRVKDALAHVA